MGTAPILLHYPTEANISDLVLKKMGITPKPATPAAAPAAAPKK
jgi:outer membrane protein